MTALNYQATTIWMLFERAVRVGSALVLGVLVARYLGAAEFGLLSYAQSVVALLVPFALFGTANILSRDMVMKPEQASHYLSIAFSISLLFGAISYALLITIAWHIEEDQKSRIMLIIVGIAILAQGALLLEVYFQSFGMGRPFAKTSISVTLTSAGLKLYLISSDAGLYPLAATYAFDSLLLMFALLYTFWRSGGTLRVRLTNVSDSWQLLKESWPYLLSAVMITIYVKIDQIMIREYLGTASVGEYSAAARLSEAWYIFPLTVVAAIYPAILEGKMLSVEMYQRRLGSLYSFVFYGAITVSILVTASAQSLVDVLLGDDYRRAGGVLMIHIWASVFVFIGIANSRWLLTEGLHKIGLLNACLGCAVNIALNFFWIPHFGITGAAWATLISYAVSSYLGLLLWKGSRRHFFFITRSILKLPEFSVLWRKA